MAKGHIAIFAIVFAAFVLILAGCAMTSIPSSEGRVIVKQSGGSSMLSAQCNDPSYIENTSDYIVEGEITSTESKWVENKGSEGRNINTYSNFTIERYIKGKPLTYDKIQIVTDGGCIEIGRAHV